jgi:hypothetical protein
VDHGLYRRSKAERGYAEGQMALDKLAENRVSCWQRAMCGKRLRRWGECMRAGARRCLPGLRRSRCS